MRLLLAVLLLQVARGDDFDFPAPCVEVLAPKGFRLSIPDVAGSTLFAVHINVNEEFDGGLEAGQIARDVVNKKNGRWVFTEKNKRLKKGDRLYYWLYLIVDGLGQHLLNQEYVVGDAMVSCGGDAPAPVTDEPLPEIDIRIQCIQKSVTLLNGLRTCSGAVVFHDDFSRGLGNWSHDVMFSEGPESDFTVWTKDVDTSGLDGGRLFIKPRLLEDISNSSFIDGGHLELKGCTSRTDKACKKSASWWSILPPVMSSRLSTKHSVSFLYGEVEIRAKLPVGDWIVPELWLESKEVAYGAQSGRMYLGKALGNPSLRDSENNEIGGQLLHQGYLLAPKKSRDFRKFKRDAAWSSDFHVFKLRWAPDSIAFFVDDEEMGRTASNRPLNEELEGAGRLAPFDREFYISLGVHVGGRDDFPDDVVSGGKVKPWANDRIKHVVEFWKKKDDWYPTWRPPQNRLLVDYVKVTAL